jgi:hypothetical protein
VTSPAGGGTTAGVMDILLEQAQGGMLTASGFW